MICFKFLVNQRMFSPLIPKQSKDLRVVSTAHVGFPSVWKNLESFPIGNRGFATRVYQPTPGAPCKCLPQVAGVLHRTWGGESVVQVPIKTWHPMVIGESLVMIHWSQASFESHHGSSPSCEKIETVTNIGSNEYAKSILGLCWRSIVEARHQPFTQWAPRFTPLK